MNYLPLLLLIPLAVMAVSDFRRREVGLWWMVAFIVGSVSVAVACYGWRVTAVNALQNILITAYLSLGVIVYLRLRYGRWVNPLKSHTGEDDLLLALGMTPLFAAREYLIVLLAGLVVSLIWWGVMVLKSGGSHKNTYGSEQSAREEGKTESRITIPLVGTLGCCTGIYLIYKVVNNSLSVI